MKFRLEIELNDKDLQTGQDVSEVLDAYVHPWIVDDVKPLCAGTHGVIDDANGKRLGEWEVVAESPVNILSEWADTITQHNLLSTATEAERREFIHRNISAFNRCNRLLAHGRETVQEAIEGRCMTDEELAAEREALSPADRAIVDALPTEPMGDTGTCCFCGKSIWRDADGWRHDAPGVMPICNHIPEPVRAK